MSKRPVTFLHAILPISFLMVVILYGLIARPLFLGQEALSLEVVFILAAFFSVSELFYLGFSWHTIQDSIVKKISASN